MADFVVDTNVWVTVDKPIAELKTLQEIDCLALCQTWLRAFVESDDRLVLDLTFKILREYRANITPNGLARAWLNQLETQPRGRKLIELLIAFDSNGHAQLPSHCEIADKNDRKLVAVALAHTPTPPIINATDTDWHSERAKLEAVGIALQEVCSDYIETKRKA